MHRTLYTFAGLLFSVSLAFASPATFVTALPVAKDQLLIRFNAQPTFSTRSFHGVQFPVNIGYGLTSRWALFFNLNQGFGSLSSSTPPGSQRLSSGGSGDMVSYARYTLFKIDKPKSTFRIAPLAGAFIPAGDNSLRGPQGLLPKALQTGSGTFDPYFGITMGYNTVRWGMALDTTYRKNPVTNLGISPGDQFRSDAQVEYKLLPLRMPEEGLPKLLVLSFESNYVHDGKDRVNGALSASSGGNILRQDAVLEISTLHWQVGLGGQVPVMQDLTGIGRMKQRSGFFLFFEYYLAAPNWRGAKARR
ncbi:MAG: hypothetical protein M3Z09_00030 [Acidobacteriota bacterium]|nr:hypothetical protein [Acidobacteriota bacterium]